MAYYAWIPQLSAKYKLTGPNGVIAVFNDTTDANNVGVLSEITGLDSAEVREVADDKVQSDGGVHGDFWYGRRPIVLTATVFGHSTVAERAAKIDKVMRASQAMRGDAILQWKNTEPGALDMMTYVRRQQPLRISGAWNKEIQLSLVSEWAPVFALNSQVLTGSPSVVTLENRGSYPALLTYRITGPSTNPVVATTGAGTGNFIITGLTIPSGRYIDFDMQAHTATWDDGGSGNQYIDYVNTVWPTANTGNNTFTLTGGGTLRVTLLDAWA